LDEHLNDITLHPEHFISAILAKNTAVIASGNTICAVCKEDVGDYAMVNLRSQTPYLSS
jgi:hypothetical protein